MNVRTMLGWFGIMVNVTCTSSSRLGFEFVFFSESNFLTSLIIHRPPIERNELALLYML